MGRGDSAGPGPGETGGDQCGWSVEREDKVQEMRLERGPGRMGVMGIREGVCSLITPLVRGHSGQDLTWPRECDPFLREVERPLVCTCSQHKSLQFSVTWARLAARRGWAWCGHRAPALLCEPHHGPAGWGVSDWKRVWEGTQKSLIF